MNLWGDVDAGPLDPIDPATLRTFAARPSFESLVADAVSQLHGLDTRLAGANTELAQTGANVDDGFDGELADVIGDGVNVPGSGLSIDAAGRIEAGDNLDQVRQSVEHVLPPPEASVDFDYVEPPAPPNITAAERREDKNNDVTEVYDS